VLGFVVGVWVAWLCLDWAVALWLVAYLLWLWVWCVLCGLSRVGVGVARVVFCDLGGFGGFSAVCVILVCVLDFSVYRGMFLY